MEGGEGVTIFTPSLEGMMLIQPDPAGDILTKPFLDVCKLILPVIDKFGASLALVKSDIGGNITRLETKHSSDPSKYSSLYTMVQEEVDGDIAKGPSSCANGLLWLTRHTAVETFMLKALLKHNLHRAMDFLVKLFRNLLEHPDWAMAECCTDSYGKTLKKYHGWMASSAFSVAMKLAPDRKKFMEVLSGTGDVLSDMGRFCSNFSPILQENHNYFIGVGLNNVKAA